MTSPTQHLSGRLGYTVEQVWGDAISRGEVAVSLGRADGPDELAAEGIREQYWAIPRAESAQFLVPRARRAATASLAEYARLRPMRTRVQRRVLAIAAAAGIPLSRDVVNVRISDDAARTILEQLAEAVGSPQLHASLGVRSGANAKPTLELRGTDGVIVGYAKLGWTPATIAAVRNEARALAAFDAESAPMSAPEVLAGGQIEDRAFVVVAPLPSTVARIAPDWSSLSAAEARGPAPVTDRRAWGEIGQVQAVAARTFGDPVPPSLVTALRGVVDTIVADADPVPVAAFWHGDFVPWNLARDRGGRLWLFDWETAEPDAPAGLDTLHWFAHSQGAPVPDRLPVAIDRAAAPALPVLRSLGHSRRSVRLSSAWHAVTLVARAAAAAEALGSWDRVQLRLPVLHELLDRAAARLRTEQEGT